MKRSFPWKPSQLAALAAINACGGQALAPPPDAGPVGVGGMLADASRGESGLPRPDGSGGKTFVDSTTADATTPPADSGISTDWTLPHFGGPVWRQSTVPYCNGGSDNGPLLWADERGVFASQSEMGGARTLLFNDGTGWAQVPVQPPSLLFDTGMSGIAHGGQLIFYGGPCVTFFDGSNETCVGAFPIPSVFAVNPQRIVGLAGSILISYNGSYFVPLGKPLPRDDNPSLYRLWADEEVVVVAAGGGKVYVVDDPSADPVTLQIPDGKNPWSLWGFGRDDLWVGDENGRLAHWDGGTWTVTQRVQGRCAIISNMWGQDHVLYFGSSTHVERWSAGRFQTVLDVPCSERDDTTPGVFEEVTVTNLWETSPSELFIALREWKAVVRMTSTGSIIDTISADPCGPWRLLWFDGQTLGQL